MVGRRSSQAWWRVVLGMTVAILAGCGGGGTGSASDNATGASAESSASASDPAQDAASTAAQDANTAEAQATEDAKQANATAAATTTDAATAGQVTLYVDSNYRGAAQTVGIGTYEGRTGLATVGNDRISSLKVGAGLSVLACENDSSGASKGRCVTYAAGDYPSVGAELNDKFSYVQVSAAGTTAAGVQAYAGANYTGASQVFPVGVYEAVKKELATVGNDAISSIKVPAGYTLQACEHDSKQANLGRCRTFAAGDYSTLDASWDNIFSYLKVTAASGPQPQPASVQVKVEVPAALRTSPYNVDRYLTVPPGFGVRVYARQAAARFMAELPNGDLLLSVPSEGAVKLLRKNGANVVVSDFVRNLDRPHDLVVTTIGTTTYVYIAQAGRIVRAPYQNGDNIARTLETLIDKLPTESLSELQGAYGHVLKNIAIAGSRLYVSIASATNSSPSDALATPVRGAIYVYDLTGKNGRLYARGLRNAEGLAIKPDNSELWAVVNNRDNIAYPYHRDFDGDGKDDYGRVMQSYVDNHPPEPFTNVLDGANYGWPYCNPNPDTSSGLKSMPFDRDVQNNADGSHLNCDTGTTRLAWGLPAHAAPLGMSFWTGASAPADYRNGAVIAQHGCWNCQVPHGYKVSFAPLGSGGAVEAPFDLVTGFLSNASNKDTAWARPVDVVPNRAGNLYISDDKAGTIFELYRR